MKFRILLIHPGCDEKGHERLYPPWGLILIAKTLIRNGHEAVVIDFNGDPEVEKNVLTAIRNLNPSVVGFTAKWGHACRRLLRILKTLRSETSDLKIILGGPLLGNLDENHSLTKLADQFILGAGETGIIEWLERGMPDKSRVFGISSIPADLDQNGIIPPNTIDLSEYIVPADQSDLGIPALHVSAARGCVGNCAFCYRNASIKTPFRTMDHIRLANDMAYLSNTYYINGFYFVDDTLLSNWKWSKSFCDELSETAPEIRWGCSIRGSEITPDRLRFLWKGGCRSFYMGLETSSDSIRTEILDKKLGGGEAFKRADMVMDFGFNVRASIMIGIAGEGAVEMQNTFEAVRKRKRLLFDIFCYTPLPGAPLSDQVPMMNQNLANMLNYDIRMPNCSDASDEARLECWHKFQTLRSVREGE